MKAWRFYVYRIMDGDDVAYIGKGSGARLRVQRQRFGLGGEEIARFKREKDAYEFERACIAEYAPPLNKHPGGNGSRASKIRAPRRQPWEIEIERVGSKVYAARVLLKYRHCLGKYGVSADQLRQIERVAELGVVA